MLATSFGILALCVATAAGLRPSTDLARKETQNNTTRECCCQQRREPSNMKGCDFAGSYLVDRGTKQQCCAFREGCKKRPYHRTPYVDASTWVVAAHRDHCDIGFHAHGLGDKSNNYKVSDGQAMEDRLLAQQCCCTSTGVSTCEDGGFLVETGGSRQCCGFHSRGTCQAASVVSHFLSKAGLVSKFVTTQTSKCEPGDHAGESQDKALYVNAIQVKDARRPAIAKWAYLSMQTYHRVSAVRVEPGNFRIAKGETLFLSLEAVRFGKLHHSATVTAASNEELQTAELQITFEDDDIHKEFYIKLKIVKGGKEPVVIERKVYVSGHEECGVGFFDGRNRNCEPGYEVKSNFLKHQVPNYGIGIEYELVGVPKVMKGDGEYPSSTASDDASDAEEDGIDAESDSEWKEVDLDGGSLLETSSDEAMNATQHVTGLPCTGQCKQLKKCLWRKDERAMDKWFMEVDTSVGTLLPSDTLDTMQHQGVPFEIVSPPVVGMAGVKSATDVLQAISNMGAQAPPSAGLHVHVNMRSKKVGADVTCSMKEVFAVWLNWVRYQNVIDEMQSPNRIGNDFARSLDITGNTLDAVRIKALKSIFRRGHDNIMHMSESDDEEMTQFQACEAMIGKKTYPFCKGNFRLPSHDWWVSKNPEKFLQLNLTPLGRFGTFEFRSGTATLDPERVARYIQFLVAFVDTFKDLDTVEEFTGDHRDADWKRLEAAQKAATPDDLKKKLSGKVEDDFFEYFSSSRPFEKEEVAAPQKVDCVMIG